ncbi:arsenate reductase (thioredoxin) [Enterococcus sp. BWR-S5]|uniref:arsenate reductase (thioredoxin) n=1 Tax=Enterococcus sp. BWR-S5 TaxID=2787714 RepID=UPI001923BFC7|nr:arsenate reductase (thioredoxin) [Enterococcus sp. BWR-S5]MBL1224568.1 arsenate reductase (thioredoxin) [Enterococcus sp. BWR-S5]
MKKIYFLCTGNSCRSQMAEGFAKKYLGEQWEVRSAGIETHGLNPRAISAMKEAGIDISSQTSDLIDTEYFSQSNLIITLCGDAADKCPIIPKGSIHTHWNLEDPAKVTGLDEEITAAFQQTRDEIERRIIELAATVNS